MEADGGIGAAVVTVAGAEGDGDGVRQRVCELVHGTFSGEGVAIGEGPGGGVSVGRAVVECDGRVVEVDEVAVGLDADFLLAVLHVECHGGVTAVDGGK